MRKIHKIIFLCLIIFCCNSNVLAVQETEEGKQSLVVQTSDVKEIKKDENVENITQVADDIFIVDYADENTAEEGLEKLENNDNVSNAFKDIEINLLSDEVDLLAVNPDYIAWGVPKTGMDHYTQFLKHKNCNTVKVAVLDTGIISTHEVFCDKTIGDRIITDYSENYTLEDDDPNYESKKYDVTDDQGHGTMVASAIAECTPSNVVIAPVKVLDKEGRGYLNRTIAAIAKLKGSVDVVNLSLGSPRADIDESQIELYEKAFKSIYDNGNGPIIVCAAGNDGINDVSYPACSEYTIAVSAVDNTNNIAKFEESCPDCTWSSNDHWVNKADGSEACSKCGRTRKGSNFGDEVDFAAPGKNLYVANYKYLTSFKYCVGSGTSAATPFVSAAFALLKSDMPEKNQKALKQELISQVEDLGENGKDKYFGYGSINFSNSKFEKPAIANVTKTKINDYSYKISASAVCDDKIKCYSYVKDNSTTVPQTWLPISNESTDVTINFDVDSNGEYTIYFRDSEGDYDKVTCTVTEIKEIIEDGAIIDVESITLNKSDLVLINGETANLVATVLPQNATDKTVTWSSNNSSIASVDQNGKVIAKGVGQAIITAKAGSKTSTCKVIVNAKQTETPKPTNTTSTTNTTNTPKPTNTTKPTTPTTPVVEKAPSVKYRTHVQNVGWQNYVRDGAMSGTSGRSLRLEGINILVDGNGTSGGIEYSTHVQNIGWQNFVANGAMSGTSGRSLRLEAIKIRLTGNLANKYDVYYRVHCQNFGWLGWAKNGAESGSSGYGYRLEGIEIKLVKKGGAAPGSAANCFYKAPPTVNYRTHVQDVGWQNYVSNGAMSGTSGRSLRLEGINIYLSNLNTSGGIEYATHVQNIGWQNFVANGAMSGTSGQSLRLEAIKIRLTGELAKKYDVYYRVHCQNFGWMGWAKNGASAGSTGYGYRLEGIEIKLVNKGGAAPGSTANSFIQK